MNQHIVINTVYSNILENIEYSELSNGYNSNVSNLFCEYLNDYSMQGINAEIAEFLQDNIKHLDKDDIELILENPDHVIQSASNVFFDALVQLFGDREKAEYCLHKCNHWFDAWGKYYIFGCGDTSLLYIIRSSNESEAYQELVTRFEKAFVINASDVENEDEQEYNDNGNPINTDYLVLIGSLEFQKMK